MHNTNRKTNLVKVGLGDQVSPPHPLLHSPTFYCRFSWLGCKMAPPCPDLRFLESYSFMVIFASIRLPNNQSYLPFLWQFFILPPSPTFILSEQPWNSLSFVWGFSDGIQHINEGSKYKSSCHKNGNYMIINHLAARMKSGSLWNCKIHFATEQ